MGDIKLTKSQKVLLYLIRKLDSNVSGRKKLMKLMFLIEHYDVENGVLTKNQFLGNNFIIYRYGVFSFEVMNNYISLNSRSLIEEHPIRININREIELKENIKLKINKIVSEFGNKNGGELEKETLNMLRIQNKLDFFGKDVKEIIM